MHIPLTIKAQPDDETCGPTALHAIYRYYDDPISLEQVIDEVERVTSGGTIAAYLGYHALLAGYDVIIYVYNLEFIDPSWFYPHALTTDKLIQKLKQQLDYKNSERVIEATLAYIQFLEHGGTILFQDLTKSLLKRYFKQGIPILAGLSATYLYQSQRELAIGHSLVYDDLKGSPSGHFVVLSGYNERNTRVIVADPHRENQITGDHYYQVNSNRMINAIMLGVLTYDANLTIITPKEKN